MLDRPDRQLRKSQHRKPLAPTPRQWFTASNVRRRSLTRRISRDVAAVKKAYIAVRTASSPRGELAIFRHAQDRLNGIASRVFDQIFAHHSYESAPASRLQAIADSQAEMVEDRIPELRAILQRNFVIKSTEGTVVKLEELVGGQMYTLTWQDLDSEEPEEGTSSAWKWRGTETPTNQQDPSANPRCPTFAEIVESLAEDKRYAQVKLLYALGDPANGYGLLLNWLRFGTVLPKYPYTREDGCMQESGEFVEEIEVQRQSWDEQIRRAEKDLKNVPCMFLETPLGCQIKECKLRHTDAVELDEETQEWGTQEESNADDRVLHAI